MKDRILVADDDPDNRIIVSLALGAAGYDVSEARDGLEAVERAVAESPELVLLDLSMPVLSGWEAASRMKQNPRTRGIFLLGFSANALTGDEARAREAGCDGFLAKPCLPKDVVRAVAAALENRP